MKKVFQMLMISVLMMVFGGAAMAQNNDNVKKQKISREQLAERQAKYIAHQLCFDDAVTAKFITTYMDCQKEVWALGPKFKADKKKVDMNEQELEALNRSRLERSQKILDIRKKYYNDYSRFLTQKQIERVYQLEKQSINKLQTHQQGKKGKPGKMGKNKRTVRPAQKK